MEGWNFWWGIAAFFLGGLATQVNGWLAYRRQRKDRADDAADALRQRREEFELQHLVEVNQLLRTLVERADKYVAARWPDPRSAEAEDDRGGRVDAARHDAFNALDSLSAQIGFILDDNVRERVHTAAQSIRERVSTLVRAETHAAFDDLFLGGETAGPYSGLEEMVNATTAAYGAISARVRALYADRGRA
ncbi:hypothetical protein OG692_10400 [Streptomyces cellulosae]|nr:hypothetical protein OG692_10400 [Streptomyces cellulosae]